MPASPAGGASVNDNPLSVLLRSFAANSTAGFGFIRIPKPERADGVVRHLRCDSLRNTHSAVTTPSSSRK